MLVGEESIDWLYGEGKKRGLYSGLFILLKQTVQLGKADVKLLLTRAYHRLKEIVYGGCPISCLKVR